MFGAEVRVASARSVNDEWKTHSCPSTNQPIHDIARPWSRYDGGDIERIYLPTQHNRFPTWMVVVAIVILLPVIVWALTIVFDILVAMSIGGILLIVAIVWLFTKLRSSVDS